MKGARLDQNIEKRVFVISLFSNFVAVIFRNAWRHARLCDLVFDDMAV